MGRQIASQPLGQPSPHVMFYEIFVCICIKIARKTQRNLPNPPREGTAATPHPDPHILIIITEKKFACKPNAYRQACNGWLVGWLQQRHPHINIPASLNSFIFMQIVNKTPGILLKPLCCGIAPLPTTTATSPIRPPHLHPQILDKINQ